MKNLKLVIMTAALAVGGISGVALARGHGGGGKAMVEKPHAERSSKFDANKDGKLDDAEKAQLKAAFAAKKAERLARFDANKDGQLDETERTAMHEERVAKRFAMLDTNKDGAITLEEMKAEKPHRMRGHRGHRMSK
jgi:EF hand